MASHSSSKVSDNQKALQALKQVPLLHGLDRHEYDVIWGICKIRQFSPNDTIFLEGQASSSFFTLLSGRVSISTSKKGEIHVVRPGEIFGDIGAIGDIRRTAKATAIETAKVLEIPMMEFRLLLGKAPRVCSIILRNITVNLASHIVRMNNEDTFDYLPTVKRIISDQANSNDA